MKNAKKFIRTYRVRIAEQFSKRFFQISAGVSFLLILLSVGVIYWQLFPGLSDRVAIPLHYNIHFGVDLFGPWYQIFLAPALGAVVFIANAMVALRYWRKEIYLSYVAWGMTFFVTLLCFVATIFITLLNIAYA